MSAPRRLRLRRARAWGRLAATLAGCAPEREHGCLAVGHVAVGNAGAIAADEPRFLIECVGPDGSVIGPFTRLEEAWASTNYVRIDHCAASSATSQPVELTRGGGEHRRDGGRRPA